MFAVCDERTLISPYIFYDREGNQFPAIYETEEKAKEVRDQLNAYSKIHHYVIRRW